ncbi:XRE family transcriptional regulator [Caproiciproducens sp.]
MQKATKAAGNAYYTARMRAATYNDLLNSREGAAEVVCIDRTRLANIELGNITPHPEEVNLMENAYNAPELPNYFCSQQCPLGCGRVDRLQPRNLESAAMKIERVTRDIDEITQRISDIAEDGKITPEERPVFDTSLEKLRAVKKSIEELILIAESAEY